MKIFRWHASVPLKRISLAQYRHMCAKIISFKYNTSRQLKKLKIYTIPFVVLCIYLSNTIKREKNICLISNT